MSYYPDLSSCDYFGFPGLIAVGWLEAGHPFPRARIEPALLERCAELLVHPWEPWLFLGCHDCSLCGDPIAPQIEIAGHRVAMGRSNLLVPDGRQTFVAPSLILHYIVDHGYAPPQPFLDAVWDCPVMRTPAYLRLLLSTSPSLRERGAASTVCTKSPAGCCWGDMSTMARATPPASSTSE
ncbi:MAG TPA: hypothetical protein ENK18_04030 [Deltaproteobacteria bacterium]|nr:hypothetical protein [Deltaproteobacteria bacterium]